MDLAFEFKQIKSELSKIIELLQSNETNSRKMKMYDLQDLQEILHVSRRTISTWLEEGNLPHMKLGVKIWLTEEQFKTFLEANSHNTKSELKTRQ